MPVAIPRYGRRRERSLLAVAGRLLSEIRSPTSNWAKIIVAFLAFIVFCFVGLLVVSGFFVSRALMPLQAGETIDPTGLLGNAQTIEFESSDGRTHNGWFFPGLRGGPMVVICHGYKSSRSEILTLATSLQQHRYNVLAFNFAGHGESPVRYTTLGYKETEELLAALKMLAKRTDIDTQRMGLWGYSLGGYGVLSAASQFPLVKAVVVDSLYPRPEDLLRLELRRLGADRIPALVEVATAQFRLVSLLYHRAPHAADAVQSLEGIPKLFVTGANAPELAALTRELYERAPEPKELVVLPRTNVPSLMDEERRNYENLVVQFFFRHLPLAPPRGS